MLDRRCLALWVMLALAGCGGGGGGGSNNAAGGTPPAPVAQLALDAVNVPKSAKVVFYGLEAALFAEDRLLSTTANFAVGAPNPLPVTCSGGGTADVRYLDKDNSGTVTSGDETRVVYASCAGLDGELSLAIMSMTTNSPLGFDSLRGEVTFDFTRSNGDRYRGRLSLQFSATSSAATWTLSAIAFEALHASGGTESFTVDSFEIQLSAAGYRHTFNGRVANTASGDFTFSTEIPLTGVFGELPTAGAVVLRAGNTRARLATSSDPAHAPNDVEIKIDAGSGQFGAASYVAWADLASGFLFGVSTPVISQLRIQPSQPRTGDLLSAIANVIDPSGGTPAQLTFVWRRNGVVITGQNGSVLPAGVHRKGDVIEVTVTASEGGRSDTKSAQVTVLNTLPTLTNVVLSPAAPFTHDDVRVTATTSDADGDAVTVSYAWQRNSQPVPAVTGDLFAASLQVKNDVVGVRVTADDGEAQAFVDAAVTIRDSPPAVSVLSAPTQATFAVPTGFQAHVTDADPEDDPALLRFVIDHGPAGMTVDPVTGAVSWTPSGPLFDRSTNMHWGVTVNDATAAVVTGTIEVVDPGRDYPLARTGIEPPYGVGAVVRVGDFDDDGDREMLVLGQRSLYELAWNGTKYVQTWSYPFPLGGSRTAESMVSGDVDGDGRHEIFLTEADQLVRLDGASRRVAATASLGTLRRCSQLELADVNADAALELVCLTNRGSDQYPSSITIFRAATFDVLGETPFEPTNDSTMLAVGNIDSDPRLELILSTGAVYDGGTLADDWTDSPRFGIGVAAGDVDGDGVAEIVGIDRDWMLTLYKRGNTTPIATVPNVAYGSALVRDLDGDSRAEVVVAAGQSWQVRVYRYDSALTELELDYTIAGTPAGFTGIAYGNVDGDPAAELIWTGDPSAIVVAEVGETSIEWQSGDPSFIDGPLIGGELATLAGEPTLVFATAKTNHAYGGTRLLALSPADGEVAISEELGFNATSTVALTTSDYDNDLTDEVLLSTARGYSSYLTAYDLPAELTQWESPEDIGLVTAVAHADFSGDGRDDLVALTADRRLYVYDVYANASIWQTTLEQPAGIALSVTDLDGDGDEEIVTATYNEVAAYSRVSGGPEPFVRTALFTSATQIWDMAIGDTDGDGHKEVFVVAESPINGPTAVHRLDETLTRVGAFVVPIQAESVYIEDLGFARKNLILPTAGFAGGYGHVVAFDADTGAEIWRSPRLPGYVSRDSLHFVDVTGSGDVRLSLGTDWAMLLTR